MLQSLSEPTSLYGLIMIHRIFVIIFSLLSGLFLVIRFQYVGLLFVILYESLKYYMHGNLLLGESLSVYAMVYLFGILLSLWRNRSIGPAEFFITPIAAWFVIVMREPYIPLVLVLYTMIFLSRQARPYFLKSLTILSTLTIATITHLPLQEYIYQLITVNSQSVISSEINRFSNPLFSYISSIFYPLMIIFSTKLTHFGISETIIAITTVLLILKYALYNKQYAKTTILILLLSLAAIRPVDGGKAFYGAYKGLLWLALCIFFISHELANLYSKKMPYHKIFVLVFTLTIIYIIAGPKSHIWEKVNRNAQFDINYNASFTQGEVIKTLAKPTDTLFVDGYDSLVFTTSSVPSAYKFKLFYPVIRNVEPFVSERMEMFKKTPPTFYIWDCVGEKKNPLPNFIKNRYRFFHYDGKFTCLGINKDRSATVSKTDLQNIQSRFKYELR